MLLTLLKRLFASAGSNPIDAAAPDFAAAYRLYENNELAAAEQACRACASAPVADRDFLLGLIAEKRGELDRAAASMSSAVEARPDEPGFRYALGRVQRARGRPHEAIAHLERFEALTPDTASAALTLADAHNECSQIEEARAALARHPDRDSYALRLRRALMLPAIYSSRSHITETRERFSRELDELLSGPAGRVTKPESQIGLTPFYLAYHHANNAELLKKTSAAIRRAYQPQALANAPQRRDGERLRVGFVSTFFHSHSVGRITIGLVRDLPRSRFSVHVFALDTASDPVQRQFQNAAEYYLQLPPVLDTVRDAIAGADLDVLVFADLGMHPLTYFLAHSRLAQAQVVWWGHPETTGIDTIDFFLASAGIAPPGTERFYTERLLRPDCFFLPGYERPRLDAPIGREALGLPAGKRLYACLQPLFKLHPDMDAVLSDILERDAEALIVLLESRTTWARQIRDRFATTLGANAARVIFLAPMPHQRFLATLAACDVSLDPLYFGGGNSTCEALALGVPVVTLPGDHVYGKLSAGLCAEIGLTECVVASAQAYAEVAVRFASDRDFAASVKRRLSERSDALFERKEMTLAFADLIPRILGGETQSG